MMQNGPDCEQNSINILKDALSSFSVNESSNAQHFDSELWQLLIDRRQSVTASVFSNFQAFEPRVRCEGRPRLNVKKVTNFQGFFLGN